MCETLQVLTKELLRQIGDINVLVDGEAVVARDEALDEGFDDDIKTRNRNLKIMQIHCHTYLTKNS